MKDARRQVGRRGEEIARSHLEKLGFSVLESNYRTGSSYGRDGLLPYLLPTSDKTKGPVCAGPFATEQQRRA